MNLRDKLERLDRSAVPPQREDNTPEEKPQWIAEFEEELQAKIIQEGDSTIILKENYYPAHRHHFFQYAARNGFKLEHIGFLDGREKPLKRNLKECLFIDLETTGLSGGAGTFAFLIGLGHVELDHIVVRQYLIPDYQYEWLALKLIENNLREYPVLVSFNGKTFDIPLLRARFVLNRKESPLESREHLDILHMARRVWKRRLDSCELQSLEYHILGQKRVQDIPGAIVPQLYFEYLRKRRVSLMEGVLEHNYHDIVNLVLLFIWLEQVAEEPLTTLNHPVDMFSVAKYFYQAKLYQKAEPVLEYLIHSVVPEAIRQESMFLLAMLYKKDGNPEKGANLMRQLLEKQQWHPAAIEELAKFYEHKEKDYEAALDCVNQGLKHIEILEQLEKEHPLLKLKSSLKKRQKRLYGKSNGDDSTT
ncbi:MAG: metal-dependent exonucleaseMrfB [Calditrichia bacterium]